MYAYIMDSVGCTIEGSFTSEELAKFQLAGWQILADAKDEKELKEKIEAIDEADRVQIQQLEHI